MRINKNFEISKNNSNNSIITNLFDGVKKEIFPGDSQYHDFSNILKIMRKRNDSSVLKNKRLALIYSNMGLSEDQIINCLIDVVVDPSAPSDRELAILNQSLEKMVDFFSEFSVEVSKRFLNTFAMVKNPAQYCINYFKLQDHESYMEIKDKVKSPEFTYLVDNLSGKARKVINHRIKVYYGAPGTGKTTKAAEESQKMIVCSQDMEPKDLMDNFDFVDGKATFKKSDLWLAIENGWTVCLDEMNMLPFESLRFLQGILDDKQEFEWKNQTIKIHPDFKIIGTMNLTVSGETRPLPEPLVDRCSDIVEFKSKASNLLDALI